MELALIVYVISLLGPISGLLAVLSVFGWIVVGGAWALYCEKFFKNRFWPFILTFLYIFVFLLAVAIPSEKTAYLMVGAYATQKIAEAPKTQELGAEVLKIIEFKIKHYAKEAEQEALKKLEKK